MARVIGWKRVDLKQPVRFQILSADAPAQQMDVLDRNTKTVYTIQAAGKAEFEAMLNASQERWVQISESIEG